MQFELFENLTATLEKKPGPNRSVSNTTYYLFSYPLKVEVLFGKKQKLEKRPLNIFKETLTSFFIILCAWGRLFLCSFLNWSLNKAWGGETLLSHEDKAIN